MATTSGTDFYLDDGALAHLLSFLDAQSLCAAGMTCRSWNTVASDDILWRSLHSRNANPMINRSEIHQEGSCCHQSSKEAHESSSSSSATSKTARYLSFKESYAVGQNWKTGRAGRVIAQFPGASWNSAARLHPDGSHAVLASAGMGSVDVVHVSTGQKCAQYTGLASQHMEVESAAEADTLDSLYSSVAIAPSCRQVAFGGFDGVVSLYDISRSCLLASASVPAPQPAVTALGFCSIQTTQVLGAGLSDGRVALSPLQEWEVCLGSTTCSLHGRTCNLIGCHGQEPGSWATQPRQISGPWLSCSLGTGVEVRRIKGECGAGAGLAIVAGTSGGHVKVVDGAVGRVRSSLVGSCSCPVKCLSLHRNGDGPAIPEPTGSHQVATEPQRAAPQELSRVVYAGFDHSMMGNGHYNAIFVWDVNSTERVALLHPGDGARRCTRGGHPVRRRLSTSHDMSGMIRSVWADGWKVAVSAGKGVTVFETRTWRPLYELSIPACTSENGGMSSWGPKKEGPTAGQSLEALQTPPGLKCKGSHLDDADMGGQLSSPFSSPVKLRQGGEGGSSPVGAGWSLGRCGSSSPEKLKGVSGTNKLNLEEVSESPGSLIFFGNTLAVGLKNDRYALITFKDQQAPPECHAPPIHVRKYERV